MKDKMRAVVYATQFSASTLEYAWTIETPLWFMTSKRDYPTETGALRAGRKVARELGLGVVK